MRALGLEKTEHTPSSLEGQNMKAIENSED